MAWGWRQGQRRQYTRARHRAPRCPGRVHHLARLTLTHALTPGNSASPNYLEGVRWTHATPDAHVGCTRTRSCRRALFLRSRGRNPPALPSTAPNWRGSNGAPQGGHTHPSSPLPTSRFLSLLCWASLLQRVTNPRVDTCGTPDRNTLPESSDSVCCQPEAYGAAGLVGEAPTHEPNLRRRKRKTLGLTH
jgi:hypothetical protein